MSYFSADSGRPLEPITWRRASLVTTLRTQGPPLGNPLNNRHGQASGAWGQHPPGSISGRVLGNVHRWTQFHCVWTWPPLPQGHHLTSPCPGVRDQSIVTPLMRVVLASGPQSQLSRPPGHRYQRDGHWGEPLSRKPPMDLRCWLKGSRAEGEFVAPEKLGA